MSVVPGLLEWFDRSGRDLPWRRHSDPYAIWVSEIMLQQTTARVVSQRFEGFLDRFPDVVSLARADEEEVLSAWAGLGYYRRARALHAGARVMMEQHAGAVPADEAALLDLPGVGPYTAAAIAALAFARPVLAVDGNVARVLARLFDDEGDVSRPRVRRGLAQRFLDELAGGGAPGCAEALIELGALICRPGQPDCGTCPLQAHCRARRSGRASLLPNKAAASVSVPVLSLRALVWRRGRLLLVRRDPDASLLAGFWELPGVWASPGACAREVLPGLLSQLGFKSCALGEVGARANHSITQHRIRAEAWHVAVRGRLRARRAAWKTHLELDQSLLTTETTKLLRGLM